MHFLYSYSALFLIYYLFKTNLVSDQTIARTLFYSFLVFFSIFEIFEKAEKSERRFITLLFDGLLVK